MNRCRDTQRISCELRDKALGAFFMINRTPVMVNGDVRQPTGRQKTTNRILVNQKPNEQHCWRQHPGSVKRDRGKQRSTNTRLGLANTGCVWPSYVIISSKYGNVIPQPESGWSRKTPVRTETVIYLLAAPPIELFVKTDVTPAMLYRAILSQQLAQQIWFLHHFPLLWPSFRPIHWVPKLWICSHIFSSFLNSWVELTLLICNRVY